MFKKFTQMPAKQQFLCFMALMAGYFSPLLGLLLFAVLKLKKADKLYQRLPLIGGAAALIYYVISYIISILL